MSQHKNINTHHIVSFIFLYLNFVCTILPADNTIMADHPCMEINVKENRKCNHCNIGHARQRQTQKKTNNTTQKMSNTYTTTIPGMNTGARERQAVPVSYKAPAMECKLSSPSWPKSLISIYNCLQSSKSCGYIIRYSYIHKYRSQV